MRALELAHADSAVDIHFPSGIVAVLIRRDLKHTIQIVRKV